MAEAPAWEEVPMEASEEQSLEPALEPASEEQSGEKSNEGSEEEDEGGCSRRGPGSLLQLAQGQVLSNLKEAWDSARQSAAFSVGGSLGRLQVVLAVQPGDNSNKPGVFVRFPDGGEADLQALISACSPATFGRGSKEVLDASVRSALAAPASRVFPQFDLSRHSTVLPAVLRQLLPAAGPLRAELHGLNVYREGGFFKSHRDTPRGDPNFVGSLVVCLPVGHTGGGLCVEHGGHSVTYEWSAGAAAGEVQWAAFFSDCFHEVLEVTSGARVTLAYELFAGPDDAFAPLERALALAGNAGPLLRALVEALDSNSFMVNGGKIGFACQHAYPASLVEGIQEHDIRGMLKGEDLAVARALALLGVPFKIVRVWKDETDSEYEGSDFDLDIGGGGGTGGEALLMGPVTVFPGQLYDPGEDAFDNLTSKRDIITWLGGREAFPEWILGAVGRFYYGNCPTVLGEFYCALGIVAQVPPFADRTSSGRLDWAGRMAAAATAAGGAASKRSEPSDVGPSPVALPQRKKGKEEGGGA